jgi:hypothetical protein
MIDHGAHAFHAAQLGHRARLVDNIGDIAFQNQCAVG